MQQLDFVVPYEDRCVLTPSGSAVVWPFMNASKGHGPHELFLGSVRKVLSQTPHGTSQRDHRRITFREFVEPRNDAAILL